ncbi:MAG: O-antigen translocase [Flavobacteriaceae bacterium]
MKKIKNIIQRNILLKIASLNTISVLVKVFSGLLTSKAIAFFVGVEGMALIGNLRNFISSIQAFSTLGFSNAVVKYVSELKLIKEELSKSISTSYILSFLVSIILSCYCFFNADYISGTIFYAQYDFGHIIKVMALGLPFYASNIFLISILNGQTKYKEVLIINIYGQVLGLIVTLVLIWQKKLEGALIAVVLVPAMLFFLTIFWKSKFISVAKLVQFKELSLQHFKKLSAFSIMALFSATVIPLVTLYIRFYIVDNQGITQAGYWETMLRISNYYLMFVTSLMSLYILPKFSSIDNSKDFRNEVIGFYKTIIPIFALGLLFIYFLRTYIVQLVFSKEFQPVENLFLWQLLGDFVKVLSLVISYQFLAKKMFWHYIIVETFSLTLLYLSSIYFIDIYGAKGATIAHFVTFTVHYVVVLLIFRASLFSRQPQNQDDDNEKNNF